MTIPTTGNITSAMVQTEWGFALPFTSEQVRVAASLTAPWTSEQLRGKSALSISIYTVSYRQVRAGGYRYYDQITFGIQINGAGTPSSYSWGGDTFGTGSTVVFNGPIYDTNEWTYQQSAVATCSVVIDGRTYSDSKPFTYTTSSNN